MSIKVMISFSNMLFAEGIKRILDNDETIEIIDVLKSGNQCNGDKLEVLNPDVILVDFITLYNSFPNVDSSKRKFVLLDTDCGRENIVSAIISKRLRGVLLSQATSSLLKRSIKAVANGEVWIDKSTVKNLLYGINAVNKNKTLTLSEREKEIVALIGRGYKNKEIASQLCISEPTVKTHLRRIFQKLDIKNRSQLITYALKNNDAASFYLSKTNQHGS